MGVIKAIANGIKNTGRAIRMSRNTIEDTGYGVHLAKAKFISFLKGILKTILYQFLVFTLILVLAITAVSVVFEMFSFWKWGDEKSAFNIDPRDTKEWADSLSDADIKAMHEYGASIHPRKVSLYAEIEDKSYQKNVNIEIPVEVEVIIDGASSGITTKYEDYLYTRGDAAYPYRQWWQSVAGLDTLNDTADKEKNIKIIKNAEKELKPIFSWADPKTPEYKEGSTYNKTSKYEKITTGIVNTLTINYKNGEEISNKEVEVITKKFYPLPFLEEVETMFARFNFKFDKINNHSTSTSTRSHSWVEERIVTKTVRKKVIIDGKEEIIEDTIEEVKVDEYTTEVITKYTNILDSWSINHFSKEFISKFMDFLKSNKIDTKDDPQVMYYMAEMLPQNYDFVAQYGEYLDYADATGLGGFKGGFGGSFTGIGNYEISPSDFIRNIPLFIQTDKRWGGYPYCYYGNSSNGTIGTSGCGPTSMAMAITGLGGYSNKIDLNSDGIIDPYEAAKYSLNKGHRIYGSGTSWAYFNDIGKATGLNVTQVSPSGWREVLNSLKLGNPVIASMGPGAFTKGGHYITLVGIDKSGRILVNDSNSVTRSNQSWSFENIVLPQAKQFWIITN